MTSKGSECSNERSELPNVVFFIMSETLYSLTSCLMLFFMMSE